MSEPIFLSPNTPASADPSDLDELAARLGVTDELLEAFKAEWKALGSPAPIPSTTLLCLAGYGWHPSLKPEASDTDRAALRASIKHLILHTCMNDLATLSTAGPAN